MYTSWPFLCIAVKSFPNISFGEHLKITNLVASFENCEVVLSCTLWLAVIALQLNSFLFLLRLWGVFMDGTVVRFTFVILWLAAFTCSIFSTFYAHAKHIGPTKQCYTDTLSPLASLGYVAFALYDTLVFFVSVLLAVHIPFLVARAPRQWRSGRLLAWARLGL